MTRLDVLAKILERLSQRYLVIEYDHETDKSLILVSLVGEMPMRDGYPYFNINTLELDFEPAIAGCLTMDVHDLVALVDIVKKVAHGSEGGLSEHEKEYFDGKFDLFQGMLFYLRIN